MIETGYCRIQLSMQLQPAQIRVEGTLVNFAGETQCRVLPPGTLVNFCYPIIVYSVANYRAHLSHFWANM